MKRVDAHMEDELWLDVRGSARADGRSINAQIRYLLRCALMDWHSLQRYGHQEMTRKKKA